MGQIKNIKLHIVTDIKVLTMDGQQEWMVMCHTLPYQGGKKEMNRLKHLYQKANGKKEMYRQRKARIMGWLKPYLKTAEGLKFRDRLQQHAEAKEYKSFANIVRKRYSDAKRGRDYEDTSILDNSHHVLHIWNMIKDDGKGEVRRNVGDGGKSSVPIIPECNNNISDDALQGCASNTDESDRKGPETLQNNAPKTNNSPNNNASKSNDSPNINFCNILSIPQQHIALNKILS